MPLYDFEDKETKEQVTLLLSISQKEVFLKDNPQLKQIITRAPSMVSGINFDSNQDSGWKDNLSRIAEAHPSSALADKVGGRSTKTAKVNEAAEKAGFRKSGRYNFSDLDNAEATLAEAKASKKK